jgi:hypothetical protein
MKIGVSTVPWGKTKRPRRAALDGSVERTENDTGGPGLIMESRPGQAKMGDWWMENRADSPQPCPIPEVSNGCLEIFHSKCKFLNKFRWRDVILSLASNAK